ncbi:MAG: single-stranded-DNA-specific exonuclease RecJ [Marinilabiliaceae bacterium]
MGKRWNICSRPDERDVERLARQTGLSGVTAALLLERGISTPEAADAFLNPRLTRLHDPFLMRDMDLAVERIERAIANRERVLVYGDYDVDGTTAVALVYRTLRRVEGTDERLGFYVPDRYTEGYGISDKGLAYAQEGGFSLVIALDCGIKSVERMREARQLGIDFIICDHHVAGDELPDVAACLDPKRPDCPYPDKNLSGCGVGYKLMEALYISRGMDLNELTEYLDMLVISIASDIVPMTGENRIFAYHGLRRLNSRPSVGIKAIMDVAGVEPGRVGISDIVFKIGPRINAAGRIKSGADAVRLLIATDAMEAMAMSCEMDDNNDERKDLDREITREAMDMVDSGDDIRDANAIVVFSPTWSKGVIGIVASRLTETFARPAVVLTRSMADPSLATGSARSLGGFDLYGAIESCSDLLDDFGGHTHAAGLTMKLENVDEFRRRFVKFVDENRPEADPTPSIDIDLEVSLSDIDRKLIHELDRMEPFGPGNTRPTFMTRGVYDYSTSKVFGHARQHIKLDLIEADGRDVRSGVGFGLGYMYKSLSDKPFDICYTIDKNIYRGRPVVQLMIKDIHLGPRQ